MTDLVAFLKARIDEDESIARYTQEESLSAAIKTMGGDGRHKLYLARYDPARVLREVAAKRRIIDEHRLQIRGYRKSCSRCHYGNALGASWPCATVEALAAVYADHPDYDPKWDKTLTFGRVPTGCS